MNPRIGIHWIGGMDRRLCMEREWRPARSTFANTLLAVIRYVDQHDQEAVSADDISGAEEVDREPGPTSETRPEEIPLMAILYGWRDRRLR